MRIHVIIIRPHSMWPFCLISYIVSQHTCIALQYSIKLMKGKALGKHSLHEKTTASVLLKLFISSNLLVQYICNTASWLAFSQTINESDTLFECWLLNGQIRCFIFHKHYYLLQLMFSACVAAVKSRPVLYHCVIMFFWS